MFYSHREGAAISLCKSLICKMIVKVLTSVILFLIRLTFPLRKSNAEIIRKHYGGDTVKEIGNFEKVDC